MKKNKLTPVEEIQLQPLKIFFKKPILIRVLTILTMEHGGYRNIKTLRNINRLFTSLDMAKYKSDPDLKAYIWCISRLSKLWLDGVVTPDIALEVLKTDTEYNDLAKAAIEEVQKAGIEITPPEAEGLFKLISDNLQLGYLVNVRDEVFDLFEGLDPDDVSSLPKIAERLSLISRSVLDIKYSTSMLSRKTEFNTGSMDSISEGISKTIDLLNCAGSSIRTGIKRLNTMLSPAYMDDTLTVYAGLPGAGKSIILLKAALDARRYNIGYVPKTPGLKPVALYITMENTFEQSIERLWKMCYDTPITNYSKEEATKMVCKILGINKANDGVVPVYEDKLRGSWDSQEVIQPNIEIILQYYPYRAISTEDLYTIIQDLKEDGYEVCILVLDYIKRIRPSIAIYDNVKMELSRIINELKALAVIYHIPVVTGHQLNRLAAESVDNALRKGKGDLLKETGRNNIGDAWEIVETADNLIYINREVKPMTEDWYMTFAAKKRRRLDNSKASNFDYFAHPFAKHNGLRLLDDVNSTNILSVPSLITELDPTPPPDHTNAVPRLQVMPREDFVVA